MKASIITITYDRKSKERIKEEYLKNTEIEESFQEQFVRILAQGLVNRGIIKSNNTHELINNIAWLSLYNGVKRKIIWAKAHTSVKI